MNITLLGLTSESPPNSARSGSRGKSTATAEYRSDSFDGDSPGRKRKSKGIGNMDGDGGVMLRTVLTKTANTRVRRRPVLSNMIHPPVSVASDRVSGRAGVGGGSPLEPTSSEFPAKNDGKINMKLNDDATINIGGTNYRLSSLLDK